ncbi:MAG: MarR family winged helix-turn-helix transcriptional regulator [Acutalibacteraceae bacterium]
MSSIMRKMNIISRCESVYRANKSSEGLPGIYHSYIMLICKNPGISQEKLAKYLCINKSNVTRHLSFLESNGYVTRSVSEKDKREMLVYPTEKMLGMLEEVRNITKEWNEKIAVSISGEEMVIFLEVLDKLFEKAKEIIYGEGALNENGI